MVSYIFFLAVTLNVFFIISLYDAASGSGSKFSESYVVLMDGVKMKALENSLETKWHEEIIQSISTSSDHDDYASPPPLITNLYTDIFTAGFSAKLTEQQLEILKGLDGFVSAFKDELFQRHTTHSPQFLGLLQGKGLWSAKNLASDVIIGLVDTGIWPEHQSFNDTGLSEVPSRWKGTICETGTNFRAASDCNKKLIGAAVFFNGYESVGGIINGTSDYKSARDSDGHGTHTASTAGGNVEVGASILGRAKGNASGMRFTARIAAYKACFQHGCAGSDIIAAMDQAVKDGVDVLSLSLGGVATPYYNDIIAIAAFRAIQEGVIVSMSAGNSGPNSSTVSNLAPWLMTVAASSTDRSFPAHLHLGNGKKFTGDSLWSNISLKLSSLPLVYDRTSWNSTRCVAGSLSPALVKGSIVICVRGVTARVSKGEVVKAAGGAGMILANGKADGEYTVADAHVLPAIALGYSDADAVIYYVKKSSSTSSPPKASIVFKKDTLGNRAPVMASYTSRGPNSVDPNLIKPDITAPGVNILAAWPPNISPSELKSDKRRVMFNIISGTSMSCPHVSGLMALLKSHHPEWSPAAIKSALMTTAYVYDNQKKPIADGGAAVSNGSEPANPFAFGSGHVDPEKAAEPGLIYDISAQDYLNYLCGLGYNPKQMEPFAGTKQYETTNCTAPGDLNYPSFSLVFRRNFTGTTSYKRTVTNVGIGVSTYSVNVTEPKGVSIAVQPDVLQFSKMGEKKSYNVIFKARKGKVDEDFTFGYLEWASTDNNNKYSVRSPVAVTWTE